MNPKDILNLKYKNISGDYFTFRRAKTERATKENPTYVRVHIDTKLKKIKETYETKGEKEDYIFPWPYTKNNTGETARDRMLLTQYFVKMINDGMKVIAKDLKIKGEVTCYVARHSFATILKNSGTSTEYIQEMLGHENIGTTKAYLGSFSNDTIKERATKLAALLD